MSRLLQQTLKKTFHSRLDEASKSATELLNDLRNYIELSRSHEIDFEVDIPERNFIHSSEAWVSAKENDADLNQVSKYWVTMWTSANAYQHCLRNAPQTERRMKLQQKLLLWELKLLDESLAGIQAGKRSKAQEGVQQHMNQIEEELRLLNCFPFSRK